MFSRLPITLTAALVLAMPVLIVGLLLSFMWNIQSREAVKDLAGENLKQLHVLVSVKISDLLSIPPRVCRINERLVRNGVLDTEDLQSWWPIFSREFSSFEMLSSIVWGDADGRAIWITRYSDGNTYWAIKEDPSAVLMQQWRLDADGQIPDEPPTTFEYDLSTRPWFQTPLEVGGPAWTDPFIWAGGDEEGKLTLGISYGIPIYREDGSFHGIIDSDFSLNDLSDFLQSINIGRTGMSMVLEEHGHMLAASNGMEFISEEGELLAISSSEHPLLLAVQEALGDGKTDIEFSGSIELDDSVYYMQITPLGDELGLNWTLASVVPEQDYLSGIDAEFKRSSLVSLIAVILSVLVGIIAARWLISPLLSLVGTVRRIGQGDLKARVHIRHAPEYVKLGNAINDMAAGLEDRIHVRERLEATTQSTLDAMVTIDPSGLVVEFNVAAERMFGYSRDEVLQEQMAELIVPPELRAAHYQGMKHYIATGEGPVLNQRIEITGMRSDGSIFPIELAIVPFEFEGATHYTATIRDLTEAKERQQQLDELQERENLLRRELDHRVKNMLAQIVALSRQTADQAGEDKQLMDSLVSKISSLSGIHELLGRRGQQALQFRDLLERCCEPYLADRSQLALDGEDLHVHPNAAMCLSLVCNELANNARKYGALAHSGGRIENKWRVDEEQVRWTWVERNGNAPGTDAKPGFGTQLIESLIPYELDGEVDIQFSGEGLVFEARIPIEKIVAADLNE